MLKSCPNCMEEINYRHGICPYCAEELKEDTMFVENDVFEEEDEWTESDWGQDIESN